MTHLNKRRVGQTKLEVPVLGLGTAPLGGIYARVEEPDAQATFRAAWEGGLRLYDTAPWYGLGRAEHRTGAALRDLPRYEFTLTTKVGRVLRAPRDRGTFKSAVWQAPLEFEVHHAFDYDSIMRSYEDSLQRLGINRIDALYIHDLDRGYFPDEDTLTGKFRELESSGYRALEELKRTGEVSAIGAGINEPGFIARFLDVMSLDLFLVASRYTLLEQSIYQSEIVPAGARGASVVVGGVFNSGVLATGPSDTAKYEYASAPAHVIERVTHLTRVAEAHGIRLAAAALQFPLAAPEVASVVFGAANEREVSDNLELFNSVVPAAFWSDLRAEGLVEADVPLPGGA